MLALLTAVPRVTVSAPVPPISVLMLVTVPVLVKLPSISLLVPAPRSIDTLSVSAVESEMVSLPVPPVIVSAFATVAVLVKLTKVSVSLPEPRLMLAFPAAVPA